MVVFAHTGTQLMTKFERSRKKHNKCPCCSKKMETNDEITLYESNLAKLFALNISVDAVNRVKSKSDTLDSKLRDVLSDCKLIQNKAIEMNTIQEKINEYTDSKKVLEVKEQELDGKVHFLQDNSGKMERVVLSWDHLKGKFDACSSKHHDLENRRAKHQKQVQDTYSTQQEDGTKCDPDTLEFESKEKTRLKEHLQTKKEALLVTSYEESICTEIITQ